MVTFNEISGSPKIIRSSINAEAERRGKIAWGDADALIAEVFPSTINAGIVVEQGAGISFPGKSFLHADRLEIVPFFDERQPQTGPNTTQDFDTLPTYLSALAIVSYTTQRFSTEDDEQEEDPVPFLQHRWSAGGEFQHIGGESTLWELDDEQAADVEPSVFVPIIEHQITWSRIKRPPFATIRDRIGKVNDAVVNFKTGTIAIETLVFVGAELQRQVLSDGARAWEVTYRFSEKRVASMDEDPTLTGSGTGIGGWNHFWRSYDTTDSNVPGFYRVILINASPIGDSLNSIYKQASFAELFQSG